MVSLYKIFNYFFYIIEMAILVRIIFSFFRIGPYNPIVRIVYELTEPVLHPAREIIYKLGIDTGMFDFSPLLAIFLLEVVSSIINAIIFS